MKHIKYNIRMIINVFFLMLFVNFLVYFLSSISVYPKYIGYYNNSNYELAEKICNDDLLIGIDGGCNRITAYCEKFWFPIHTFSYCFDGRIEWVFRDSIK